MNTGNVVYQTTSPALDSLGATPPTLYRHHDGTCVIVRFVPASAEILFLNASGTFPDRFGDSCRFPNRAAAEKSLAQAINRNSPRRRNVV